MKTIRYTVPVLVMLCVTGAALADAGHDAKKEPAAMEEMDHSKMKMDGQGDAAAVGGHWMAPEKDAKRPNPVPADNASRDRGRKLFEENCVSCHGLTGRGNGPIAARLETLPADLAAMAGKHPDGDFAWKIAEGRGAMPAWKKILSEKQIWDIVNYLQKELPRPGDDPHSHGTRGHRH